jgi:cell wall-associated NlpC family hydrolase
MHRGQAQVVDQVTVKVGQIADVVEPLGRIGATKARVLLAGSYLPGYDAATGRVSLGSQTFYYHGRLAEPARSRDEVLLHAYLFLNAPYQWGGRSLFGLDCSGFTQMVYRLAGVALLRDASQQATQGETLSFLEEAQPGDLAFFDNDEGRIIHVGMLVRPDQIIHCSGQVRLDGIDQHGIYNFEERRHTHRLRLIKSILTLP